MPELEKCSGYTYLRDTVYNRESIKQIKRPAIAQVETFKKYPDAEKIELPRNWKLTEARIVPLLQNRRSLRNYQQKSITLQELAFLLWASQGITAQSGDFTFRTTPSGGALYPVETYISVNQVEDLTPGLYHFDVENFVLERLGDKKMSEDVAAACLDQTFMADSAVIFLWSAVIRRCMNKYGNRGMRYIFLDAGHICQNLLMAAEAIGNGGCPIAAFYDDELNGLLNIHSEEETVLYTASIGKKSVTQDKQDCI